MKEGIKIVEVGARDGLQNEAKTLSVADRVEFIRKLLATGLTSVEGGSFVSPKAIPQLVDSEKVWEQLQNEKADISYLVPNQKGLARAITAGVRSIAVFTATSDTFNQKNIGMSVEDSLNVIRQIATEVKANKPELRMRGYLSTAFGCPYEGNQSRERAFEIVDRLFELGCVEVSVGDTIGVAHPKQVRNFIDELQKRRSIKNVGLHFHDTRGMAIANIQAALEAGIRIFDSSVGGLGGCPYATGSSGNVATEEVCWLLEGYGFETGVSIEKLLEVSKWIETKVERRLKSKLYLSQPKKLFFV
jgi:hydroxymethylglutaryl-CoA lyase